MDEIGRKRIAVLLGQPEEYTHERFLKGFLKEAFARDYDVCMFAMYIKYQNTPARCVGETSIFQLPSYDKFDAVVVMADTIQTEGALTRIEERLRAFYDLFRLLLSPLFNFRLIRFLPYFIAVPVRDGRLPAFPVMLQRRFMCKEASAVSDTLNEIHAECLFIEAERGSSQ